MMLSVPGYQLLGEIHQAANSVVYRGRREQDALPVIVKIHQAEAPGSEELVRFKREFEIARSLQDLPGVVRVLGLHCLDKRLALVMEDCEAESLSIWAKKKTFTLEEVLSIARQAVDILEGIHAAGVVHKDIKPAKTWIAPAGLLVSPPPTLSSVHNIRLDLDIVDLY